MCPVDVEGRASRLGCDCDVEGAENENVFEFEVAELGTPRDGKPSAPWEEDPIYGGRKFELD